MIWLSLLLIAYGLIAGFAGMLFGESHQPAAIVSLALLAGLLTVGQVVNRIAARFGAETAILGDAARVLLRLFALVGVGITLELFRVYPPATLRLWAWLASATLMSLIGEIAFLLRITK